MMSTPRGRPVESASSLRDLKSGIDEARRLFHGFLEPDMGGDHRDTVRFQDPAACGYSHTPWLEAHTAIQSRTSAGGASTSRNRICSLESSRRFAQAAQGFGSECGMEK